MATLEQELIEQIRKLDESDQRQVFSFVQGLTKKDEQRPSIGEALKKAEAFQDELKKKYGENHYFNSQQLLDELREEASEWPRP